jgi:rubrerythrin
MTNPADNKFIADLKMQMEDESKASGDYQYLANTADALGHYNIGTVLKGMAEEEKMHRIRLELIVGVLSPIQCERQLPVTPGDWAELGVDIKERDPRLIDEVNNTLLRIYAGGADAEEAKSWFIGKANELGIPV